MKKLGVFCSLVFFMGVATGEVSAATGSVREKLVAMDSINVVVPLDATTTYVAPKVGGLSGEITEETFDGLYAICNSLGGSYQQREDRTDPITRKVSTKYLSVPQESIKRKSDIAYSSIVTTIVTWKPATVICKDVFSIDEPFLRYFSGYAAGQSRVQAFVITHKPEPLRIFKTSKFKADSVKVPVDGYWTKTLTHLTRNTEGAWGFLDKAFDSNNLTGQEAWLYLNTLADQSGEKVRYAINPFKHDGKMCVAEGVREVSQGEAARYIALGATGCGKGKSEWYVAATGGKTNFVAMGKENRSGQKGDIIQLDVYFENNRSLDDLTFFSGPGSTPVPASAIATAPTTSGSQEEQFALQVATNKTNMINSQGGIEFQGIYNGVVDGCDSVAVVSVFAPGTRGERSQTMNYKVCNGRLTRAEETLEGLPPNINQDVKRVAQMAQQRGFGLAQVQGGYLIQGKALRSADKCLVEVKIFNGQRLLNTQTINACTQ